MKTESEKAGEFFTQYASQFDNIYDTQKNTGLTGWINRTLRKSMFIRFKKTFESLQPIAGSSVLDVGCGSGRYIVPCLQFGAERIVGIDMSQTMLDLAQSSVEEAGADAQKVQLISGEFSSVDFDQKFDYAIVIGVMDYIEDPLAFLRKLAETFTKTAVVSFPVSENIWKWQRKIRYRMRGCPLYFYDRKKLEELLADIGVASWTIEKIQRDYFVTLNNQGSATGT